MNLREVLSAMIDKNASDLHLIEGNPPAFVINGSLVPYGDQRLARSDLRLFLDEVVEDDNRIQKLFQEKELDFAYELEGKARFRINAYFQRNSIAFSVRMIPIKIPSLTDLSLPPDLMEFTKKRSGLVLVIGPAKSGKSTTVAAMVNMINEESPLHIVTIEDPIEYVYKPVKCVVSQREVSEDTHSFADALKHVLRLSPGVIVVDGARDRESVKMVLEAAETGHLVFCTFQAWNIVQTIHKMVDYFPENERKQVRTQIAHTLKGVVSQRLLRRADGKGYVCACEVMKPSNIIQAMIREDDLSRIFSALEDMRKEGMITMNDSFLALYKEGLVDIQEIVDNSPGREGYVETLLLQ